MSWKHVKTPHLPEGRVGLAAIGERYRGRLAAALEKHGADALWLPDAPGADGRLAGHADLSMLHLGGGRLLSACGAGINARLEALGFDVIEVPEPGAAYPGDCALNACIAGGRLFHRLDISAKAALDAFPPEARVNIAQGYAKCCTSVADERSIISSDRGIALAARRAGLDVLEISPGYIELEGFGCGFIGGASFKLSRGVMAFTGDMKSHPDWSEIELFLRRREIEPVFLTADTAFDVGSVLPLIEL